MILYYFPIAQNTVNKTVSIFFRDVYACICMCSYFTIFPLSLCRGWAMLENDFN